MPATHVERSVEVGASPEAVHEIVRDFRRWPEWSPWLISEPECKLTYDDDGMGYSWSGKIIGVGRIEITGEDAPHSIDYRLTFLKPFKSVSSVRFAFDAADSGTRVSWSMDGKLPFFLFFLKRMMETFVGMDYERGLRMLKDYAESGSSKSRLEFPGIRGIEAMHLVGIRTACRIEEIGSSMEQAKGRLVDLIREREMEPSGHPVSAYHRWSPMKNEVEYTVGFPLKRAPVDLPDGFVAAELPTCRAYEVRHTGAYRHLGNAWSAGIMHGRAKLFAQDKKMTPFEIYESDPAKVDESDLVTLVCLPVK